MQRVVYGFIGFMLGSLPSQAIAVSERWLERYAYDAIQHGFNNQDISIYQKKRGRLDDYPLSGYLDYRAFLFELRNKSPEQVNQFSNTFADYPFSVSIRADYLNALIATKNWKNFIAYQTELPRDQDYQCWYYTAFYHEDKRDMAFEGAKNLWLNGESVSDACDALFRYWDESGGLTDEVILQRALYAIEANNPRLIRYLRQLVSSDRAKVILSEMLALYRHPERFIAIFKEKENTSFYRHYAQVMLKHLATENNTMAYHGGLFLTSHFSLTPIKDREWQSTTEFIAVRLLEVNDPKIIAWRDDVFRRSQDDAVVEQRIRLAIRQVKWREIRYWIDRLSEKQQASYRWQYWVARSQIELGEKREGEARLQQIAGKRHFYSIAASIALKQAVHFPMKQAQCTDDHLVPYQKDIDRVEELLALGKTYPARKHWRHLISKENEEKSAVLACYAKKREWYLFTHEATIRGELWDYIHLRFPVRYWKAFTNYGAKYNVDPITLLALARQESGLELTTQSPVGARGLMQVLPSTAAFMAEKYNLSYRHSNDLFDLNKNVAIGSRYLSHLLSRYQGNRAYAFSAYNAGPSMVAVWRKQASENIDVFGYIESISFKETRVYVKNLFMFEWYYREILEQKGPFLRISERAGSM